MFILLLTLFLCHTMALRGLDGALATHPFERRAAANPFEGRWRLDTSREVGSSDEVLRLIGVDAIKRSIIRSLSVTERYELSERTLRLVRDASVSHTDETFRLGVPERVNDVILGAVEQLVTYAPGRITTQATRPDHAVYVSVRRIQAGKPNQFTNTMNFTTADGQHASCVRYYNRI